MSLKSISQLVKASVRLGLFKYSLGLFWSQEAIVDCCCVEFKKLVFDEINFAIDLVERSRVAV